MRSRPLQNNLTGGELSRDMDGRFDMDVYYAGARSLKGMITLPQGGATRAPGTLYKALIPDVGQPYWLLSFEFRPDQTYTLVLTHETLEIYRGPGHVNGEDVLEQTLAVPWTRSQIPDVSWCQSADTLLVFHADVETRRILRDTTQAVGAQFTIGNAPFTNIPTFNFKDAKSPASANEKQRISFADWAADEQFRLKLGNLRTERINYSSTDAVLADRILGALEDLSTLGPGTVTVTAQGGGDFDVEFIGSAGGKDWEEMEVRLTKTSIGTAAVSTIVEGGSKEEPVWSSVYPDATAPGRGWPSVGAFYGGRLFLCASKSRPGTVWGSKTNDFFNFDVGDSQDDDAINHTNGSIEQILHVVAGRNLEVFATEREMRTTEEVVTPTNFALQSAGVDVGSSEVRPVRIDGASLFVDRAKRGLFEFVFGAVEDNYQTEEVSLLAQHLVKSPVDMAVLQGTRGDYAYVVNADGTLSMLNRKRGQDIAGMTPRETDGKFERVCSVNRVMYAGVERTIAGATRRFLERFDESVMTDCAKVVAGNGLESWTGFGHLLGAAVQVKADGNPQGEQTVTGTGEVTTEVPAYSVEVGLAFEAEVIPMPLNVNGADGPVAQRPRRIVCTTVTLKDSAAPYVNGYRISDRFLGSHSDDQPPPLLNGDYDVRLRGYDRRPEVKISQPAPMPLTVLAVGYVLEAN